MATPGKENSLLAPGLMGASLRPALSLRRNFAWTLLGNLAYAASQWAMFVLLTKAGSPELVGRFALGIAITGPVIVLASLQLRSMQVTDAAGEYAFGDYLALRLLTLVLALAVIAAVALAGGYRWEVATVILALGAAKCVEAISDVFLGLFQRHERMDLVSLSTILKSVLSLTGFTAGFLLTGSLLWAIIGLGAAWLLVLTLFDLRWGRELAAPGSLVRSLARPGRLMALAWLALPLGLGSVLYALEVSAPRYFIEHHFGERELGMFAAMAYLTAIGTQAINALGQAASPKLARYHAAGQHEAFLKLLLKLVSAGLLIGAAGFVGALLGGRALLGALYTPEYAQHHLVFVWLMAAAGVTFGYVFLGTALNALRVFRPRVPMHLLTLSLLIPACWWLGRQWGLVGVAWSICASQVVSAALYLWAVLYHLRRPAAPSIA